MCGIAGMIRQNNPVDIFTLEAMLASMAHRGPDDSGTYFSTLGTLQVGLGSTRLSILDLSHAGHMPMSNRDGTIWVVYNGEIYNHLDLRDQAVKLGFAECASRTDTESLIQAYQAFGLDCFQRLNGMFAVAIVDHCHQRLVLARDRMGIKPLYYYWDGSDLVFASELKTLVLHPAVSRAIDHKALNIYLALGYVPSPYCMLAGVKKLSPGHLLVLENGVLQEQPFWRPTLQSNDPKPLVELVSETRTLLQNAVSGQLMGDVPLGVLLSGGLDSTIITALACRYHPSSVHTFSIGFRTAAPALDPCYNLDFFRARLTAQQLGTLHHEIICDNQSANLIPALEEQFYTLDEPLWEASHISLKLLAVLAREHGVKVLLTGDGSDELFGGYPWYVGAQHLETYEKLPWVKPATRLLHALTPSSSLLHHKALDLNLKYRQPVDLKYLILHQHFDPAFRRQLLVDGCYSSDEELLSHLRHLLISATAFPLADQFAFADQLLWVREHFNQRLDRMLMSASVEGRVPFQDNAVVDFNLSVRMDQKIVGCLQKYLLRSAFQDILPPGVLSHTKRPFAAPILAWLRGGLKLYALENLNAAAVDSFGILSGPQVEKFTHPLIQSGFPGRDGERNAMLVWNLLTLCGWMRQWLVRTTC
jgi:asparagine synthase (glutamine-hydrolysing)